MRLPFLIIKITISSVAIGLKNSYFPLRACLHGEFQPGLKFRSAHRAEILLRLHGQFQPGRKTLISVRKFTEVRESTVDTHARAPFSARAEKMIAITWIFQPVWPG